ncbi:MAG: type II secretion system protein N [Ghiorsea sp.]
MAGCIDGADVRVVMLGLPRWVEYGLVLLAAWLVAGMFVTQPSKQAQLNATSQPAGQENEGLASPQDFMNQVDLFGKAKSKAVERKKPVAVVASQLKIKLIGTVVAGDKSAAMVTLNSSKKQHVFFIGHEIQKNVTLQSVEPSEIVVDNHGKMERISLEKGKAIVSSQSNKAKIRRPKVDNRRQGRNIDRGHLQKQMRNFSTLLSQARVAPHFTNKKADGFTITEIVKGSLYEEIGLLNGDVIQKVNGESVTSAEQAMRMYRELQNSTFIDVELMRGGSVQQVSYTIQ